MSLLEKSSSIEISRRTQPFYSKKQSYSLGQQVQIEVDVQREFLDFEHSRLVFDVTFTKNTDNYKWQRWGASAFVKNLRVKTLAGQMIGHEIREYRAFCRMYQDLTANNERIASYDDTLEGASDATQSATQTVQFAHKFMLHLFSIKEYYPAHFHQGLMIEFDLPANVNELAINAIGDTAANLPSITAITPKYVCDLVQLKPEIENEMVKLMEEQKLFADYIEVLTQENSLSSAGGENYDIVGVDGRVKSIFQYQVKDTEQSNTATEVNESYQSKRSLNGLTNYRFKLGANYLNYESIQVSSSKLAEQTMELLKALDIHDSKAYRTSAGNELIAGNETTDYFVVGVKVDKAQKNSDSVISSMIDKDRNNVRVELSASGAVAATSYTHVVLDKRIQILPGSIVRQVRS